jgi:hypothetical protein
MPKITNTRKQRAAALLTRITDGPVLSDFCVALGKPFNPLEASKQYRIWARSWVVDELKALIPELKEIK